MLLETAKQEQEEIKEHGNDDAFGGVIFIEVEKEVEEGEVCEKYAQGYDFKLDFQENSLADEFS